MKIYCVDYDKVIVRYKSYIDQSIELDSVRLEHVKDMSVYKKEMESIMESGRSGLLVDENLRKQSAERFKEVQALAMTKENKFRSEYTDKQNYIMESCFNEISNITSDFASKNEIDIIINKSQIFYVSDKFELTDKVIDLIKEKDLYVEFTETEKESV